MPYIANTDAQRAEMLAAIGVGSFEELLDGVPRATRADRFNLPDGLAEQDVMKRVRRLAGKNAVFAPGRMYAGAGIYNHYIPPVVAQLAARSEFVTAYTPYQPEVSQGLLQTIFEYQTYICELTGLDISNASTYDGAVGCADAVNIARAATKRGAAIISPNIHPHSIDVVRTYNIGWKMEIGKLPYSNSFEIDLKTLDTRLAKKDVACVVVQMPNFYGYFETGLSKLGEICKKHGTLLAVGWYPFCAPFVARPGDIGADIAFGEGQPLGIPMGFGGPALGFLACRSDLVRFLPGRLIGKTEDANGKTAYVMTLQAREQHIRRDKATSSICTNQALMALTSTIYLSSLGKQGFREVGELESAAAKYLEKELTKIRGVDNAFPGAPFFNEFTIDITETDSQALFNRLVERDFLPGVPLANFGGDWNRWLIAATEQHTKEDIDEFVRAFAEEVSK
ncbi:MAG: aminomethyl-transferring glycine dehydrogenase subunit GcvPA [bacterium]|jgi:glycine dehydrogenase subunit 1